MADDWQQRLSAVLGDLGRPRYLERVAIFDRGRWTFVALNTVDWIKAADNYVQLHVIDRTSLLRKPISRFALKLDPDVFLCSRHFGPTEM